MTYRLRLPLLAVVLFCLTSMAGCPNVEPGGQRTVAKGTVTNLRTGQPLPGVKMLLVSSLSSVKVYTATIDSVVTDGRGQYTLSFTNEKGSYYAVSCEEPYADYENRLDLPDSLAGTRLILAGDQRRVQDLKLGTTNVANYQVSPRRVVQMLVNTRFTNYQRLVFMPNKAYLPADYQLRTVYLYQPVKSVNRLNPQAFYQQPSAVPTAVFLRNQGTAAYQDTTVQPVASTALTGDTIRATVRFGR